MFKQFKLWLAKLLLEDELTELEERRKNAKLILNTFKMFEDLILVIENAERYYQKDVQYRFEYSDTPLLDNQAYSFEALRRHLFDRVQDKLKLISEIKRLRRALALMADPIPCLKQESKMDNSPFNLNQAIEKENDPSFYKMIASNALQTDYLKVRRK